MDITNIFLFVIISFNSVLTATAQDVKTYAGHKLYEVKGDKDDVNQFIDEMKQIEKSFIYDRFASNFLQTVVPPEMIPLLQELATKHHLKATIIFEDFAEIIRLEKSGSNENASFSWTAYHDVEKIYGYMKNMSIKYPEWAQEIVGGESYEGLKIMGLRINTPGQKNTKKAIIMESGIHAREWITPATTTYFINELLTSKNPEIQRLRDLFDWHIFPTVNPDGYDYSHKYDRMWRKTRSKSPNGCYGADPNRNWDYNWMKHGSSSDPCDYQIYAGSKPFSEIETRTFSEYISKVKNLLAYIAYHSDAQCLLVPYSDSTEHKDNYDDLVKIGKTSLEYGFAVNGAKYRGPGTAAEILYKVSGGSKDWVRHTLGTPLVYTYELRGFFFEWPPEKIYEQGDEVTQMMLGLVVEAEKMGYLNKTQYIG